MASDGPGPTPVSSCAGPAGRLLLVANDVPWPATTGYRQRLAATARALARVGSLDVVLIRADGRGGGSGEGPLPPDVAAHRVLVVDATVRTAASKALRWARSGQPWLFGAIDWERCRAEVAAWARGTSYALAWFSRADAYAHLGAAVDAGRRCVDLENIESAKLAHRLDARLDAWPARLAHQLDRRCWRRVEAIVAASGDRVVVCSALDARRLPRPARVPLVVPNGASGPDAVAPGAGSRPVLLFVGALDYAPNADAVRFFAREVLPGVRTAVPEATFRVVGRGGAALEDLAVDGVSVGGEVPDVTAELARAAIVVAPLRFGGGTRIKILEAFAHGVPVVTTTVGCEGLDVADSRHLLIAEGPEQLAACCTLLLSDAARRAELAQAARRLWDRCYRWDRISADLARRVESLLGPADGGR